jgi:hypothetical protein
MAIYTAWLNFLLSNHADSAKFSVFLSAHIYRSTVRLKNLTHWAFVLAVLVSVKPATAKAEKPLTIERTKNYTQCPWQQQGPVAKVFGSAAQWSNVMFTSEYQALGTEVNWRTHDVVLFALKTQSSLGVSVAFKPQKMSIRGGVASLQATVVRPKPGAITLTALSTPCTISLVRKHNWQKLVVLDEDSNEVLATTRRTKR